MNDKVLSKNRSIYNNLFFRDKIFLSYFCISFKVDMNMSIKNLLIHVFLIKY